MTDKELRELEYLENLLGSCNPFYDDLKGKILYYEVDNGDEIEAEKMSVEQYQYYQNCYNQLDKKRG